MSELLVITGATGAAGRNFLAEPPGNFQLRLVAANNRSIGAGGHEVISVAQLPKQKWDAQTSILHLAAAKRGAPQVIVDRVNVEFTKRLALIASQAAVKNFIFTSCAYGPRAYVESKRRAEETLQEIFKDSPTRLVILRLAPLYGPFAQGSLQSLARLAMAGVKLPLADLGARAHRLYVGNLGLAIKKILTSEAPGGLYELADQDAMSLGECHQILFQAIHQSPGCFRFPPLGWLERLSQSWEARYRPLPGAEGLHQLFREERINSQAFARDFAYQEGHSALAGIQALAAWNMDLEGE